MEAVGSIILIAVLVAAIYYSTKIPTGPCRTVLATLLALATFLYMLPTAVAYKRHHPQTTAIAALNFFGGWIGIGWIGALVWAFLNKNN